MPRPSRPIELRESDRCQGTQPPPEAPGWPPWEGRVDSLGGRSTRLARSSTTRSQSMTTSPRPDLQALLPHGDGPGAITPDGCSVELYSALPPAQEPRIVHDAIPHGASILELGAGAGRVTHALLALGHPVVAVGASPAPRPCWPASRSWTSAAASTPCCSPPTCSTSPTWRGTGPCSPPARATSATTAACSSSARNRSGSTPPPPSNATTASCPRVSSSTACGT